MNNNLLKLSLLTLLVAGMKAEGDVVVNPEEEAVVEVSISEVSRCADMTQLTEEEGFCEEVSEEALSRLMELLSEEEDCSLDAPRAIEANGEQAALVAGLFSCSDNDLESLFSSLISDGSVDLGVLPIDKINSLKADALANLFNHFASTYGYPAVATEQRAERILQLLRDLVLNSPQRCEVLPGEAVAEEGAVAEEEAAV